MARLRIVHAHRASQVVTVRSDAVSLGILGRPTVSDGRAYPCLSAISPFSWRSSCYPISI